jgi:hypothetical protein
MTSFVEVVSMETIIEHLVKHEPEGDIARLQAVLGTSLTATICEQLSGQRLWIPKLSTLWRIVAVIEVMKLKGLDQDGAEFHERQMELRRVYKLTKKQLMDILKTGKYQST